MIIGVLCGSFSPPTFAHLHLSQECIAQGLCDKVLWVPSNDAYKKKTNIRASDRLAMVKLALQDESNITVSDHELQYKTTISTVDSLKLIQQMYPNDTIRFIFGADKLAYRWIQKEEMISSFEYIITPRDDIDIEAIIQSSKTLLKYKSHIYYVDYHEDISSTQVRDDLYTSGYSSLIHPDVFNYIRDNRCYPLQSHMFCPECHHPMAEGKCYNQYCILGYPLDMFYKP